MGRNCGWLTAYSAHLYMQSLQNIDFYDEIGLSREKWSVHAIYIPEKKFSLNEECLR